MSRFAFPVVLVLAALLSACASVVRTPNPGVTLIEATDART